MQTNPKHTPDLGEALAEIDRLEQWVKKIRDRAVAARCASGALTGEARAVLACRAIVRFSEAAIDGEAVGPSILSFGGR